MSTPGSSVAPANTLFLFSDEQDAWVLGCAGRRGVPTPHLDRLAAQGTRFDQAYTPSPICVPARASLATGRWVHQIGYWDNAMGYDGRVRGWAHDLADAGHRVEAIGKLHYRDAQAPTGFTAQHHSAHLMGGVGQVWGSVRDPLPEVPRPSPLLAELGAGESAYNRYDMRTASAAAQWLRERSASPEERPWMLFVGFVAPHFPLVVPQRFLDRIHMDALPRPKLQPSQGHLRHPWVQRHVDFMDHDATLGNDARRRLALACYYALVAFLDEQVGVVLDALDASGLDGSTRVIFASDHGDNQGARGLWNKCTLYRESVNVPLIMRGPGVPGGRVCQTPVNLVDLAPTFLQGAGLAPAPDLPGRSLLDIATQPDDLQRPAFSEYHAVGSPSAAFLMRQGRWVLHHYVGYEPELFDAEGDPEQLHDLAQDASYGPQRAHMEKLLCSWLDPRAIDRRAKADQAALVARHGGREAALRTGTPGATPVPGA